MRRFCSLRLVLYIQGMATTDGTRFSSPTLIAERYTKFGRLWKHWTRPPFLVMNITILATTSLSTTCHNATSHDARQTTDSQRPELCHSPAKTHQNDHERDLRDNKRVFDDSPTMVCPNQRGWKTGHANQASWPEEAVRHRSSSTANSLYNCRF